MGRELSPHQRQLFERFGGWLATEALTAGGIGPNEPERLLTRHLADSLCFAGGWPHPEPPAAVIDLGSGVGLPGIPLGILWGETAVLLVDRSARRVGLSARAVRVLQLPNVTSLQADMTTPIRQGPMVVSRAAGNPSEAIEAVRGWLEPGGIGILGGSHRSRPRPVAEEEIRDIPPEILDHPAWLRIISSQ